MSLFMLFPLAVTLGGGFFWVYLSAFPLRHPVQCLRRFLSHIRSGGGAFRTLTLALAGTLGVGNITGVALGIAVGGAGSVFWMLLSCIPAGMLKYCEALASSSLAAPSYGMMSLAERVIPRGRLLGGLYSVGCVCLALSMGTSLQSGAFCAYTSATLPLSPALISVLFTAAVLPAVAFGGETVRRVTSFAVPAASLVYISLSLVVIINGAGRIPEVIADILSSAITPGAAAGGIAGFLTSRAVREGFCGAVLSNEAGAGTSSLAYTAAPPQDNPPRRRSDAPSGCLAPAALHDPVGQGLFGMFEVVADTGIMCMLTAFSVLLTVPAELCGADGTALVMAAFSAVFSGAERLPLSACMFLFAFATVICWFCYGSRAAEYLARTIRRPRLSLLYPPLFFLSLILGGLLPSQFLVRASDACLLTLTLITVPLLFASRKTIKAATRAAFSRGHRR